MPTAGNGCTFASRAAGRRSSSCTTGYRRVLAPFLRRDFDYAPHVTVGRADDVAICERMLREARVTFPRPIDAVLRSLSILALPPDGSLSVEAEIPLGN